MMTVDVVKHIGSHPRPQAWSDREIRGHLMHGNLRKLRPAQMVSPEASGWMLSLAMTRTDNGSLKVTVDH